MQRREVEVINKLGLHVRASAKLTQLAGEARGDTDPLGRPMPQRNEDYGPDEDMLPSELAIRRAREILEMLRSRASEPELPRLERDYIDRLLRGLY